ncbi:MAG: class I SAM-dependent methyltransferase [Burkholderiaceae bacterium]|nr:class I SAM-dependent methyltransferase [Burkholderiaceae bacterium]
MNRAPEPLPPHPPLAAYYEGEAQRAAWVRRIFDRTARDYDRVEWLMALGSGSWYRRQALARAGLAPGMRVLDVGTGTGLTARAAIELAGDPACVIGVDPSAGMLAASTVPARSPRVVGCAEQLPLADACIDFVAMGFALRHVADLDAVFAEYYRVLRPGGRLCILEITRPRGRFTDFLLRAYLGRVVPWLSALAGHSAEIPRLMRYYWDTIEACVPPATVLERLQRAGFAGVERHVEGGIFSEYRARKPQ